ncbi:hypothetical protein GJ744_010277 [Endocarpon pusillum]|uniref:Phosphatidic acid phosphatase type 2/haloperoxidase domain-containing protein n=1 Tax=Endocarpon pusillum TaxID=364733 RepID=A0A8H7AIG6_9EURO|nr:hypothetical protein GJ744_010277 [Endocarpon pusillum]
MVVLPPTEEPAGYNANYILYWNNVALDLNRLVVSLGGPQNGPPSAARALGIFHLAINDAYFAIRPDPTGRATTYLTPDNPNPAFRLPAVGTANDARLSVAGAANTTLLQLYTTRSADVANATTDQLRQFLKQAADAFPNLDTLSSSYRFGVAVGRAMLDLLDIKPNEPGYDQDSYRPTPGKYKFNDDPTNPVRIVPVDVNNPNGPKRAVRVYGAPFYGMSARRIAVQHNINGVKIDHMIADPPVGFGTDDVADYNSTFDELIRQGGVQALNTTRRTPAQTTSGFFWAYDGANLIGTPVRLFNQILRKIAWDKKPAGPTAEKTNADFARLFAIVNVSLADAAIFAWQEKWNFEFWRPLTGVREDTGNPMVDPFWLELGAPATNTENISFKPSFPAYPSGHATFAGSGFQAARLYYRQRDNLSFGPDEADNIGFDFVSDELNGISRDLRQPYDANLPITDQVGTVRTRVVRHYPSLWAAMFDAGISRIFLGVHWRFDAFASNDVVASLTPNAHGTTAYKAPETIKYETVRPRGDRPGQLFPVGGVPLGIGVANDVFMNNLKPTPVDKQPSGRNKSGDFPSATGGPSMPPTSQLRSQN